MKWVFRFPAQFPLPEGISGYQTKKMASSEAVLISIMIMIYPHMKKIYLHNKLNKLAHFPRYLFPPPYLHIEQDRTIGSLVEKMYSGKWKIRKCMVEKARNTSLHPVKLRRRGIRTETRVWPHCLPLSPRPSKLRLLPSPVLPFLVLRKSCEGAAG